MKHIVFRLDKLDIQCNSHTVGRTELWDFVKDCEFDDIDDAKKYIIEKTYSLPDFIRLSYRMNEDEKLIYINDFCFNNSNLLIYNKYFLDPVPKHKIKESLIKNGIKIQ